MGEWSPTSWQKVPAKQQATYADDNAVARVLTELKRLPPLVSSWEIESLKAQLGRAANGELFLLQGGDCAERFDRCDSDSIAAKLKILLQMSLVLVHGTRKGVIRVGRIAGQFAKPRSSDIEERDGIKLPSYRGDLINRVDFTPEAREPDPVNLLRGYERSALTLNFLRSLIDGGFADMHHPEYWDLDFIRHSELEQEYERIVESIRDALSFMEAATQRQFSYNINRIEFFASHEGLSLLYEQAQTRRVPRRRGWYNLATHMPWIGKRTADLDGAHIEYFRGIANPVGVKIGPGSTPEWVNEVCAVLNPENEPGRLVLIHRMGADHVAEELSPILEAIKRSKRNVLWVSDPMHGNTETTENGFKTRRFSRILDELKQSFAAHADVGTILGGVHFEMTGENVTECIGGARGLSAEDLGTDYQSQVDPRLNYEQALEMSMLLAHHIKEQR